MNWVLWILAGLAAFYLLFVFGPILVSYFAIFKRKTPPLPEDKDLSQTYFAPYEEEVREALAFLKETPFEEVSVTAEDGVVLKGDHYSCGSNRMVIFFHGYCATPQINFCVQAKDLYRRGYDVLLVYQRGHGKSGGAHTTMGLNERYDVKPWVEWAKSRPGEPRIVLYGTSMGASTVAYSSVLLEGISEVKGMVLDSIYLTPHQQIYHECVVRRIPAKRFMMPMIRCLAKLRLKADLCESTADVLGHTTLPALFLQGTADETVPPERGLKAYEGCASEKELIVVEGAAHTIGYLVGGAEVREKLWSFLEKHID